MQHQWLSILSFIDDKILSVEDLAMTVFPHSSYLFSMVDELALLAESFPKRYDDAINTLSSLIQHLPLFEPVVKPVLLVIGSWEWRDDKEVMVDIDCEEQEKKMVTPKRGEGGKDEKNEMVVMEKLDAGDEKKLSKEEEEIKKVEEACKVIIEELGKMGMVDSGEKGGERNQGEMVGKNGDLEKEKEKKVQGEGRDPVLALFDEGWGTGIGKKRGGN